MVFKTRDRLLAVATAILIAGGVGMFVGAPTPPVEARTSCSFTWCDMGKCREQSADATDCSGEAPCSDTGCIIW